MLEGRPPVIYAFTLVESHLLAVRAHVQLGDRRAANTAIERALALAEPDRVSSGACLGTLRTERQYERMNITGLTEVTAAQRAALLALEALEQETAQDTLPR